MKLDRVRETGAGAAGGLDVGLRAAGTGPTARAHRIVSIRGRLLRWLLPLLVLILVASSVLDYRRSIVPVEAAYDQALADAALAVSAHLRPAGSGLELDLTEQAIGVLRADTQDRVFFRVIGPSGSTVGGDADLQGPSAASGRAFFDGVYRGQAVRVVVYPLATSVGQALVLVAETTIKRQQARSELILGRLLEDAAIVALSLVVVWLVVGVAMRPLEQLATQVRARSANDLRPLSTTGAPQEVRPLIEALNRLFGLIGDTQDSQRRFIENAAHQLRTPLAGLKGQVDLALAEARALLAAAGAGDAPAAGHGMRLERIREATSRVTHLANQLLTLARSDRPSHDTASRQLVRLHELVDTVVAANLDAAIERGQDLGAETRPASLRAVEWELREMLSNLVDNAIRYTPPGGRITVRCGTRTDGAPFVEVEDTGPGIPPIERERVFERFYRASSATPGGAGLGLAIVRETAALHDARVEIGEPESGHGTLVRVTFPATLRPASPSVAADT